MVRRVVIVGSDRSDEAIEVLRVAGAAVSVAPAGKGPMTGETDESLTAVLMACGLIDKPLIQAVAALDSGGTAAPIVVLCDAAGVGEIRSVLAAGARGVVLRDEMATTLIQTIDAVGAGQACFPGRYARAPERPLLSIREKQVVGLVALGLSNREVAERLFVAESTVKSHLTSAYAKLGVRSRHEAIDLIVNPNSGMGMGILALEAEPIQNPAS